MKKLIILFSVLIFIGCSKDDPGTVENSDNQIDSEVADNVVVILDVNSNLTSSESDLDNGLYVIEFTSDLPEINVNDIIVGDEGEGFLRKVTSISSDGNKLTMQTSQATIDDVFNNASIQFNTDISEGSRSINSTKQKIKVNYLRDGISFNENGLSYDFSNTVLYEEGNATLTITNGNATFDPNFTFESDYSILGGLDFLEFNTNNALLTINCELDLTVAGSLSLPEFSQTLVDYDKYLTFPVAGVPVVVVVNTQLVAELNANVDTSVSLVSNWTSTFGVTSGVKYENNNWSGNFDLSSDLEANSIEFNGQVDIAQNLSITPRVSLKLYGVVGPYCQPQLTEDFTFNVATPSLDWDAELKTGLDLTTGVDIRIFGNTLADYSTTENFEESIWNAPSVLAIESGNNQTGDPGQLLDEALKVKVTDNLGDPQSLVPVYFSVAQGGGSLDEEMVMTDENGFAQVFWTLGNNANPQSVEVRVKNANGTNIDGTPITFDANSEKLEFDYEGVWLLRWYDADDNSLYQDDRITFDENGNSTFYESIIYPSGNGWMKVDNTWTLSFNNNVLSLTNVFWGQTYNFDVNSVDDIVFYGNQQIAAWNQELHRQ